jgi:hypothetical protein
MTIRADTGRLKDLIGYWVRLSPSSFQRARSTSRPHPRSTPTLGICRVEVMVEDWDVGSRVKTY